MATQNVEDAIRAGNKQLARELLRPLLADNPSAETLYLAAKVASSRDQAIKFLHQAVKLDPFHEPSVKTLERLESTSSRAVQTAGSSSQTATHNQLFDNVIALFISQGWQVTSQTSDNAQVEKLRGVNKVSATVFLLVFGVTVFPFLFLLLAIAISGKERVIIQKEGNNIRIAGKQNTIKVASLQDARPLAESIKGLNYRGAVRLMFWIIIIIVVVLVILFTISILTSNSRLA